MVAVAPSAPKHPVAHSSRTNKVRASSADFGRILEKVADENRAAPEAAPAKEDPAPEAKPEAASHAEDQTPAQTGEKETSDQDHEQAPRPEPAKSSDAAPVPPTPQPIVPLSAAETAMTAAAPAQFTAEAAPIPLAAGKTAAASASALGSATSSAPPAIGKTEAGPTPLGAGKTTAASALASGFEASPVPPPTGKAADSPARTEGGETDTPAAEQLPAEQQLDLEAVQSKAVARPPERNASTDLLSFREMMHPDLKTDLSPEPVLDQLQQAMNTAMLDETAQLVMPQVVRGLATLVSEGMSEMRLQLQPDDLGEIEVRVRTSEGVVRGEMMVQNPEVKQMLDQHLDRLRNALHQQGLDLRSFDVGLAADGRFAQPDRSGRGFQPQGGEGHQTTATNALPETAPPVLASRGSLAVDYLA